MLLRVIARLLRLARHSLTLDMIKLKLPRPKAQCKPPFLTLTCLLLIHGIMLMVVLSFSLGATAENTLFNAVYSHALALVDKETMILPFTTPNGHTHILRHLQPDIVYLQESLAGDSGSYITNIQTWLRHDIVLVVGAEDGSGGLADSESEAERADKVEKWWQKPERVGRGRGIIVVDSVRVNDDWARRVQGRE